MRRSTGQPERSCGSFTYGMTTYPQEQGHSSLAHMAQSWCRSYLRITLDCVLQVYEAARKDDILRLAEGHILQTAELRGYYQRRHK